MFLGVHVCGASLKNGSVNFDSSFNQISFLSRNNIEKALGRKLTLRERAGLFLYKKQIARKTFFISDELKQKANSYANTGFTLSIIGLIGLFLFPLAVFVAIPAYVFSSRALEIDREYPNTLTETNRMHAKIGKVTSIVTGMILLLAVLFVIALLSAIAAK
jgi:hypothetical protein